MQLMNAILENQMLSRWAEALPRPAQQIGAVHESDAELLPLAGGQLLALTIDTVAEEIELGIYRDPRTAGRIAATASLSDLAAVGADPAGLLLAVSLPTGGGPEIQREVARGVADACRPAGTFVLGGDTSEAKVLSVCCAAVGFVPTDGHLSRVGLSAGDLLFASGPLGSGAALAAAALLGLPDRERRESSWQPRARLAEGRALRGIASACMDTSDGLIATLDQLARLNHLALRFTVPLPSLLHPQAAELRSELGVSAFPFLAAHHGEFELVFGVPPDQVTRFGAAARAIGWTPLLIGRAESGRGLWAGNEQIDGAWVRNLLHECRGDFAGYVRALCSVNV